MTRQALLESIKQQSNVSVLIIGGGINGIGTFRDLALQGVDVLLVEKGDFASGASAASSHMLHGGLRYLENAEFRLVNEALHERNRMLLNAPHYAHPLPTTIPIFKWFSGILNAPLKFARLLDRPGERGALVIKIGLMLYDWFTRDSRVMPTHRFYGKAESLRKRPLLNPDILCTATYYDAWMPTPERLCMELLADGEAAHEQARAVNYVAAVDGAGAGVTLRDELTGETFEVRPKIVINAAGPWIDFVNRAMGQETKFIGGTKGSHLMIDHPDLLAACAGHEIFFENKDGRITLFFPLADRVLAGTTDIKIDDPEQARCTDDEIDYILSAIRLVFPGIEVTRAQIVFWFTGVRPLPSSAASTAGQISRDHSIRVVPPGDDLHYPIYSLVGGKWTSFRAFAEQTADKTLGELGLPRKVSTVQRAIGGGRDYPKLEVDKQQWLVDLRAKTEIDLDRLAELFERYGTYAAEVAAFIAGDEDQALTHTPGYSQREVVFITQQEQVARLDDFVLRRSLLAMLGRVTRESLVELGAVVGESLGWSSETIEAEVARAADILTTRHGMTLGDVSSNRF